MLVKISDSQYSTTYLITQVTHTLDALDLHTIVFDERQRRDGRRRRGGGPQPSASLSASFNVQVGIF